MSESKNVNLKDSSGNILYPSAGITALDDVSSSTDAVPATAYAVKEYVDGKTVKDTTVTSGSTNLITSGAVYTAIAAISPTSAADYVVEKEVNDDGSWYLKFNSGLLMQGGIETFSKVEDRTVTFTKAFASENYSVFRTSIVASSAWTVQTPGVLSGVKSKTATSFLFRANTEYTPTHWLAIGKASTSIV